MIPRGKLLMSMNDPLSILAILLWFKLRMKGKEIGEQKPPSRMDVAPWCYKLDGMGLGWISLGGSRKVHNDIKSDKIFLKDTTYSRLVVFVSPIYDAFIRNVAYLWQGKGTKERQTDA